MFSCTYRGLKKKYSSKKKCDFLETQTSKHCTYVGLRRLIKYFKNNVLEFKNNEFGFKYIV